MRTGQGALLALALVALGCGGKTALWDGCDGGGARPGDDSGLPPRDGGPGDAGRDAGPTPVDGGPPDAGRDAGPADEVCPRDAVVFDVPFERSPSPSSSSLSWSFEARSRLAAVDLYFLFDTTYSMENEIMALRESIPAVIAELQCPPLGGACMADADCPRGAVCTSDYQCVEDPGAAACLESVWTGVGRYEGLPDSYRNVLSLQPDPVQTSLALELTRGFGMEESLYQSIACAADPTGCPTPGCAPGGIGCPGFREDAARLLLAVTDEPDQCTACPGATAGRAAAAVVTAGLTFVGVDASGDRGVATPTLTEVARRARSFTEAGDPRVFQGTGEAVVDAIVAAIREIAGISAVRVDAVVTDDRGDAVDVRDLVERVEVDLRSPGCADVEVEDADGDGIPETIPGLLPDQLGCFRIVPARNTVRPFDDRIRVFTGAVTLRAAGRPAQEQPVCFRVVR